MRKVEASISALSELPRLPENPLNSHEHPPLPGWVLTNYSWLLSFSQLGRGRILIPDTSPMAMNSVSVDDPP